jgi:hypothetical protein
MQAMVGEGKNRATYRQHLEAAAKQGDPEAEWELASQPPLPVGMDHVWGYFMDLHQTRPAGGFGPGRIPRTEIAAWQDQEGIALQPWEIRAITVLDAAWIAAVAEQQEKPKG